MTADVLYFGYSAESLFSSLLGRAEYAFFAASAVTFSMCSVPRLVPFGPLTMSHHWFCDFKWFKLKTTSRSISHFSLLSLFPCPSLICSYGTNGEQILFLPSGFLLALFQLLMLWLNITKAKFPDAGLA